MVVTRTGDAPRLESAASDLGGHVRIIRVAPRTRARNTYIRYWTWLIAAAKATDALRTRDAFGVLHHVTYAGDWFPSVFSHLRKHDGERWVWGPVGGATFPPWSIVRKLGLKGAIKEAARFAVTTPLRFSTHASHRRNVDVAVALNEDTANTMRNFAEKRVRPNALIDYDDLPSLSRSPGSARLVYAGRGVSWKGLFLVFEAFAHLPSNWTLDIAGPGASSAEYGRHASPFGSRVTFHGQLSRAESLTLISSGSVFALPSLHDSAPWSAAEAAGLGVPVLCLDLGGVGDLAGELAVKVPVKPVRDIARRMAIEIVAADKRITEPDRSYTLSSYSTFLNTAYRG